MIHLITLLEKQVTSDTHKRVWPIVFSGFVKTFAEHFKTVMSTASADCFGCEQFRIPL